MNFKQKLGTMAAKRMAKQIGKEGFLEQLKQEWDRNLPRNRSEIDIEVIVNGSMERIEKSGLKEAFDIVGITREDLVKALEEVIGTEGE